MRCDYFINKMHYTQTTSSTSAAVEVQPTLTTDSEDVIMFRSADSTTITFVFTLSDTVYAATGYL